jgi:hypothetical protein
MRFEKLWRSRCPPVIEIGNPDGRERRCLVLIEYYETPPWV